MASSTSGDGGREARFQAARDRVGREIDGVGELVDVAGMGGMAAVYRAEATDGTPLAVKLMHRELSEKDRLRERFVREARILDQADHRNAVSVYDTGSLETGEAYIVMEWLDGLEVDILWKRLDYSCPPVRALSIAEQTLDCLSAYHEADVLHRDVKPANLFITREGLVKLIDFGLARFRVEGETPTRDGAALGTPAYMAPEQALGKQDLVDERTDIFGVGATLFALLSGETVHETEAADAALVQAATNQPESLAYYVEDLDDDVVEIVDRAIEWDRIDRYQSAVEMREAVNAALERRETSSEEREESVALSPSETREQEAAAPDASQKFKAALRNLERLVDRAREESEGDDAVRRLRQAAEQLREVAAEQGRRLRIEIRPYTFAFTPKSGEETTFEFDESLRGVPYRLYRAGVREVTLERGIRAAEVEAFVQWLAQVADGELAEGRDPVTAMWDAPCPGIEVRGAIHFRDDAVDAGRASDIVRFLLEGPGQWCSPEPSSDQLDPKRPARGSTASFLRAPKGILSRGDAKTLKEAIDAGEGDWIRRAGRFVARTWRTTADNLPVVVESLMDGTTPRSLSETLLVALDQLGNSEEREAFVRYLMRDTSIGELVEALRGDTEHKDQIGSTTRQNFDALTEIVADDEPQFQPSATETE